MLFESAAAVFGIGYINYGRPCHLTASVVASVASRSGTLLDVRGNPARTRVNLVLDEGAMVLVEFQWGNWCGWPTGAALKVEGANGGGTDKWIPSPRCVDKGSPSELTVLPLEGHGFSSAEPTPQESPSPTGAVVPAPTPSAWTIPSDVPVVAPSPNLAQELRHFRVALSSVPLGFHAGVTQAAAIHEASQSVQKAWSPCYQPESVSASLWSVTDRGFRSSSSSDRPGKPVHRDVPAWVVVFNDCTIGMGPQGAQTFVSGITSYDFVDATTGQSMGGYSSSGPFTLPSPSPPTSPSPAAS